MRLLLGLLLPAAVAATVTVTPFCKNSVRVQITPSDADSDEDYKQQAAVLAQTLAEKELKELPGALIDTCGPGEPVALAEAAPVKNGNIQVASTAEGSPSPPSTPARRCSPPRPRSARPATSCRPGSRPSTSR